MCGNKNSHHRVPVFAHFGIYFLTLFFLLLPIAPLQAAAKIVIINGDAANVGFNDNAAFIATGNNSALSLGQARLNALQYAADLIAQVINSNVEIKVYAKMLALGGGALSATLGSASSTSVSRDFVNAPVSNTWYPVVLAEKLAGANLNSSSNEIKITFNRDIDGATVMGGTHWYYGLNGASGTNIDFVTVAMHELIHGLGFGGFVDLASGKKLLGLDDSYMRLLENHGASPPDYPSMTDAQRVTASTATGSLHWIGAAVTAADASLTAGVSGGHVEMYAPSPQEPDSSVSHFSTALSPNELMEPNYIAANHSMGLAAELLSDVGWGTINTNSNPVDLAVSQSLSATKVNLASNVSYALTISNNGGFDASGGFLTDLLPEGASFISASTSQGSCSHANGIVFCRLGTLAGGGGSYTVNIVASMGTVGSQINTAIIDSVNPETAKTDNVSAATLSVAVPKKVNTAGGGSGCFIATAAWGSDMQDDVRYLRAFRDHYLLDNRAGRWFVRQYYHYSPPMADYIRSRPHLRALVRVLLRPLVTVSRYLLSEKQLPQHSAERKTKRPL